MKGLFLGFVFFFKDVSPSKNRSFLFYLGINHSLVHRIFGSYFFIFPRLSGGEGCQQRVFYICRRSVVGHSKYKNLFLLIGYCEFFSFEYSVMIPVVSISTLTPKRSYVKIYST